MSIDEEELAHAKSDIQIKSDENYIIRAFCSTCEKKNKEAEPKPIKDKEKIFRDLVSTFNDRDELHKAYKNKMKNIFLEFASRYLSFLIYLTEKNLDEEDWLESEKKFIDSFVENGFMLED